MRRNVRQQMIRAALLAAVAMVSASCSSKAVQKVLNPFYEDPAPEALLGRLDDKALQGEGGNEEDARAALEHMASYQRQNLPEPYNPVIRPAVVRLMWVPEHLTKHGDFVPAHYYYLKVKKDDWALQDAFDLQEQVDGKRTSSNIPFVIERNDAR